MKYLSQRFFARWFAFAAPASVPVASIKERENTRKRRLFSVVLLVATICLTVVSIYAQAQNLGTLQVATDIEGVLTAIGALYINKYGYLNIACLFFLANAVPGAVVSIINMSYILPFSIFTSWAAFIFFPIFAGFFLPFWEPQLLALAEVAFLCWFTFIDRVDLFISLAGSRLAPLNFMIVSGIIILSTAFISGLAVLINDGTLLKAAIDLETAHKALNLTYSDLEKAHEKIQQQALTDPLTELPNHQAMLNHLEKELDRAQRFERSVSLLFFDLDHFKAINDVYGHTVGDTMLSELGCVLHQHLRKFDTGGRWGGEEFLIILPETTSSEAFKLADAIRDTVNRHIFSISGGLHITCSIGVASYPTHSHSLSTLINEADQAMCAAKRLGRNQTRVIDEPLVKTLLSDGQTEVDRETTALHGTVEALSSLVERRHAFLREHSNDVANLVHKLALKLGLPAQDAWIIKLAGHLHDIGKIGIPDTILHKPSPLTEPEWQQMQQHPVIGAEVVSHIPALRPSAQVIRYHHERWDGRGYPDHLKGCDIPLAARVVAVVDAYTTMVSGRCYQQARNSEEAINELRRCSGSQFDPTVVEALIELLQELSSEKTAISVA